MFINTSIFFALLNFAGRLNYRILVQKTAQSTHKRIQPVDVDSISNDLINAVCHKSVVYCIETTLTHNGCEWSWHLQAVLYAKKAQKEV
jgi:hypothetical protein